LNSQHKLADYVRILARGKNASRSMSYEEAQFTMQTMLAGEYEPEQLGAIFMLMRVKEESAEELAGFAAAINQLWPTDIPADLIWPSYAGKRRQPFWCFLSALLLTQMGYRILFHGTEAHTSGRLYMADVFAHFRMPVADTLNDILSISTTAPLMYLPCSVLNPQLQRWLSLKSILGVRSPINTVMKTIAPAGIASVQGVFHPNYASTHIDAARLNQNDALVIKGEGGEFEVNPERDCTAQSFFAQEAGEIHIPKLASHIDDKPQNTDIDWLAQIWQGKAENTYANSAILQTAALALCAIERNNDIDTALQRCRDAWNNRDRSLLA
jgi:anthranilate phosphoribosyltransferase